MGWCIPSTDPVAFLALWQFLAPGERRVLVAYSELLAEVHAGHVEEIRIHEREVTFRVHDSSGRAVTKETIGPIPDQALVDSLKPDDPSLPLKVYFEKGSESKVPRPRCAVVSTTSRPML